MDIDLPCGSSWSTFCWLLIHLWGFLIYQMLLSAVLATLDVYVVALYLPLSVDQATPMWVDYSGTEFSCRGSGSTCSGSWCFCLLFSGHFCCFCFVPPLSSFFQSIFCLSFPNPIFFSVFVFVVWRLFLQLLFVLPPFLFLLVLFALCAHHFLNPFLLCGQSMLSFGFWGGHYLGWCCYFCLVWAQAPPRSM